MTTTYTPADEIPPGRYVRQWAGFELEVEIYRAGGKTIERTPTGMVSEPKNAPDAVYTPIEAPDAQSDTPETDAEAGEEIIVRAYFARRLERQRNALLEALEKIELGYLSDNIEMLRGDMRNIARAAIAKAKGEAL